MYFLLNVKRKIEEVKSDGVLYLMDGEYLKEEDIKGLKFERENLEEDFVLKDRSILDSINKVNNSNYTGFIKVKLQKE